MDSAEIKPKRRVVVLDGGTGTSLEKLGHSVDVSSSYVSYAVQMSGMLHPNTVFTFDTQSL